MLDSDLLLAFAFMGLLFLRQISIIKQPNKLNYAPLVLGVGVLSSVVHMIIHPELTDLLLIVRESLFPFLISLILFLIMNIMHQTQVSQIHKTQHEFTLALIEQITQLKKYTAELETNMNIKRDIDTKAQDEVREKFKEDIKALQNIKTNQVKFMEKFEEMEVLNKSVIRLFKNFTEVQFPALDNVVHKHIDILRISEQDHHNKVISILNKAVESRGDMADDLEEVRGSIKSIGNLSKDISNSIVKATLLELSNVTNSFEHQMISLKSHSESLNTALYESENKIDNINKESVVLMKQMSLSSHKMSEMQEQNTNLLNMYSTLKSLIEDIERVKSDYVKSQSQLYMLSRELRQSQDEEIASVREQMEDLIVMLTTKIDNSLEKLHNHYHIASEDLSQSVQELTKKAQMKKGYTDIN